jgi:hypothetical protein
MKSKVIVAKEVTLAQLNPELVEYAIDAATTNAMTTRFGSHAYYALKQEYGEVKLTAAWELVGKPLKDRLAVHTRAINKIVEDCRVEAIDAIRREVKRS